MGLIGVRVNISDGAAFVDLTKALSYLTGSVVPQGSTVNVVGIDYDTPANNTDSATQTLYASYYPSNDMLVAAWRNAFAAHCNAREDLDLMDDLGEFVIGFNTQTMLHPRENFDTNTESQVTGNANYRHVEDGWYNWAVLQSVDSYSYTTRPNNLTAPHTSLGANEPEKFYSTYSGLGDIDGIIVGKYTAGHGGSAIAGTAEEVLSKFAIGGPTLMDPTATPRKTAKISIIEAFNHQNPIPKPDVDVFGGTYDVLPKYGYKRLQDIPMTLKIHAANTPAHHTIPMGGIDVFCGLLRLTDTWGGAFGAGSAPDEAGGAAASQQGTMTIWISGWSEF